MNRGEVKSKGSNLIVIIIIVVVIIIVIFVTRRMAGAIPPLRKQFILSFIKVHIVLCRFQDLFRESALSWCFSPHQSHRFELAFLLATALIACFEENANVRIRAEGSEFKGRV